MENTKLDHVDLQDFQIRSFIFTCIAYIYNIYIVKNKIVVLWDI